MDKRARDGNDQAVALPMARMTHADRNAPCVKGDLDFSFSGLKTAVLRHVRQRTAPLTDAEIDDICASFQRVVVTRCSTRVRCGRSVRRAERRHRRRRVGQRTPAEGCRPGCTPGLPAYVPALSLSTDNAAMIAAAGLRNFHAGKRAGLDLNADASLEL